MQHTQQMDATDARVDLGTIRQAYFVGSGIASLAGAAFLIRDGHVAGDAIYIFDELDRPGGSLDGSGSADKGYVIRGGRMLEEHYACTYGLFASIPSLTDPAKSVTDEIVEFSQKHVTSSRCRLLRDGKKVDVSSFGLSEKDRLDLLALIVHSEDSIANKRIDDWFSPPFFENNFWLMWATMFAFQPWHGAVELKRYLLRFIQLFPDFNQMGGVWRTPYNQYDSMVLPLTTWLKAEGVHFLLDAEVTRLDFGLSDGGRVVRGIRHTRNGEHQTIDVAPDDRVFVTLGCMTEGASLGSMTSPAHLNAKTSGGSWALWEDIANGHPGFGHPAAFAGHIGQTKWQSFTVEYSVRSAQLAVYQLLGIDKGIPPVFKGQHDVGVLFNALTTMHR